MQNRKLLFIVLTILLSTFLLSKESRKMSAVNIYKDIYISIDKDIKIKPKSIHLGKEYKDIAIRGIRTQGSLDAIDNIQKSKANIAIARGDVLGIKNNALLGFDEYKNYGIVCSPSDSILYLVSKKDIKSIIDLRNLEISTGLISNIAQLYLSNMAKNSGIELNIKYESMSLDDSLYALQRDKIDALFIFGPTSYIYKITNAGLHIISLPNDFFSNFSIKSGLNRYSYKIRDRYIKTFGVQNFIIAPKTTLDKNIDRKVEAMVNAFGCYKTIQNIDSFYGDIYPSVKDSIYKIQQQVDTEDSIIFRLIRRAKIPNGTRYVYDVINNSNSDMNITLDEFRTREFDSIPIKPRHLMSITPSGSIAIKAKSKQIMTILYENPFLYRIKPTRIEVIFKNLTIPDNKIKFYMTIGDQL